MYLGGSYGIKPLPFDDMYTRQRQTWGAFGYIINMKFADEILKELYRAKKIVDAVYIDMQKKYLCIKPIDKMLIHPQGFSYIKNKHVDYKNIV